MLRPVSTLVSPLRGTVALNAVKEYEEAVMGRIVQVKTLAENNIADQSKLETEANKGRQAVQEYQKAYKESARSQMTSSQLSQVTIKARTM